MMKLFSVAIFASLFFASHQLVIGVPDRPVVKGCWTDWFNRDTPSTGRGDWETLASLHKENPGKICKKPRAIEAQTLTGLSPGLAGDVIYITDTTTGFVCRNRDQKYGLKRCNDYRVRFSCPLPYCKECLTKWFNRDDPSGSGDFETLSGLFEENPFKFCSSPIAIEAQTVTGLSPAEAGDVIYKSDTTTGFICRNIDQKEKICNDYRVRFSCPFTLCEVEECWTEWFDGDDPSGTGDSETLDSLHMVYPGKICPKPRAIEAQTLSGLSPAEAGDVIYKNDLYTGFICRNEDQKKKKKFCSNYRVRFRCPTHYCFCKVCWTHWFNRDDPSYSGDWEDLPSLHEENPGEICEKPLFIEAVTTDTNTPSTSTGDFFSVFSPTMGFICRNEDQRSGQCRDYKVRFWCPF